MALIKASITGLDEPSHYEAIPQFLSPLRCAADTDNRRCTMNKLFACMALGALLATPLIAEAAASSAPNDPMVRQEAVEQQVRDASRTGTVTNDGNTVLTPARDKYRNDMQDARQDFRKAKQDAAEDYRDAKRDAKEDRQTAGEYMDDAAITAEVKGKLLAQKGLDSLDISVTTINGVVSLEGTTKEASQVGLAERVAREVDGVKSVKNHLHAGQNL